MTTEHSLPAPTPLGSATKTGAGGDLPSTHKRLVLSTAERVVTITTHLGVCLNVDVAAAAGYPTLTTVTGRIADCELVAFDDFALLVSVGSWSVHLSLKEMGRVHAEFGIAIRAAERLDGAPYTGDHDD